MTEEALKVEETDVEEIDVEEEHQEPVVEWSGDDEDNARMFGWKPSTEWQGEKPPGYIEDPREWMQRVERSPIFRAMEEKQERMQRDAEDSARRLEAMNQRALDIQQKQHDRELQRIAQDKRAAVQDADAAAYDRLEREETELRKNTPQEVKPEQPQTDPWLASYTASEDGKWLQNPILRKEAMEAVNFMPGMASATAQQQVEYAETVMREAGRLPKKEEKPKPRNMVDSGGLGSRGGKKPDAGSFEKLPSEAKTQFQRFVDQGIFEDTKTDREDFANDYNAA